METTILLLAGAFVSATGSAAPSAQTILEAYARANDQILGFSVHYVEEDHYEGQLAHVSLPSGSRTSFTDGWSFHDFVKKRSIFRLKRWGTLSLYTAPLSKEKPSYMEYRWANGVLHEYIAGEHVNTVIRTPKDTQRFVRDPAMLMTCYFPGAAAIGYFNADQRRLDKKLAGSNMSVRDGMERVGDSRCYVIDAKTRFGRITAWFDPEKDCALAKYVVELDSNDIERDNLTVTRAFKLGGVTKRVEVTIEAFTQANGIWLPTKANVNEYASLPQGDYHKDIRTVQMDSWSINPDFEALQAFDLKDIPDDSVWQYADDPSTQYLWNGGNLTPVRKNTRE